MKPTLRTYHSSRYTTYKTCKWCGLTKELSEFYEGRWGKKCKACVRARTKKYRQEHLEQYAEYEKTRANLPHRIEARRKYYEEHKVQISEYKKKWAADNEEIVVAYKQAHYERNRDETIARSKSGLKITPRKLAKPRPTIVARGEPRSTRAQADLPLRSLKHFARVTRTNVWLAATPKLYWRLITSCL